MPVSKMNDRDARCPFLLYHTRDEIACEGVIDDTRERIIFPSPRDKEIQYSVFCCARFLQCERYISVMQKYSDPR